MIRTLMVVTMISMLFVGAEAQRSSPQSIGGRVMDEKGEPVHKARVEFWLVTSYGRFIQVTAVTGRDGGYLITGLPEAKGLGMAWGTDPGRGPVEQPVEVTKGPNNYRFVL
ncbi:carboxypeptidase regulatory-like domain-containing protein [Candidatus Fermentibacteria bacterium]|nr:carboxypeptidase regulatory-like domain-containing protein [Candidatus Fermentibacteria bacterium]